MILRISLSESLVEILVKYPHRGPCMLLYTSLSEDLVEILARSSLSGPCTKILQMSFLRGACKTALLGCSWEFLVSRLARFSLAAAGPFMTILWDSLRGPGMKILVAVFDNSL